MSFIIAVYVNEGIVLASDRRATYSGAEDVNGQKILKIGLHTTNTNDKTFICSNGSGISTCGDSSLLGKPINGYIQKMIREKIKRNTSVEDIPQIILDYFCGLSPTLDTRFIVAGYKNNSDNTTVQNLYDVQLINKKIDLINTDSQGAHWAGEFLTISRIMLDVAEKRDGKYIDLPYEGVPFNYFTLQDAVDFARFAVETTINTMHFKNVIETVGGNVDVLVITPDDTKWIQKTELH